MAAPFFVFCVLCWLSFCRNICVADFYSRGVNAAGGSVLSGYWETSEVTLLPNSKLVCCKSL